MAGSDDAREQLIEGMRNAWVSAQMYFPDDPIEALASAVLDNPRSVLRALVVGEWTDDERIAAGRELRQWCAEMIDMIRADHDSEHDVFSDGIFLASAIGALAWPIVMRMKGLPVMPLPEEGE